MKLVLVSESKYEKKIKIRDLTSSMQKKSFNQVFKRYEVLKKLTKKSPVVFDVGACQGQTIIEMVKNFKNCKIHSFEANKNLLPELNYIKRKYKKKANIRINTVAVGNKKKKFDILFTSRSFAEQFFKNKF